MEQAQFVPNLVETPEWFQAIQQEARTQWESLDLPVIERVKFHRWPLFATQFASIDALTNPLTYGVEAALSTDEEQSAMAVHAGNQTIMESVAMPLSEQGVIVMDLFEAMWSYPELVQAHLFSVVPAHGDKVTAYNTAYLNGGLFIYIPKNVAISLPIETLLLQDSRYQQAFNKRVLIVADENSQVEYLERLQTVGELSNSATVIVEIVAKQGAQLKYLAVDTFGAQTHAYIKRYATTERDAHIDWAIGELNEGNVILDSDTYLNGDGSQSQVAIIGISNEKQIQAIDTKVVNRGKHTVGNILQHGVILDRATLTFNGIGLIEKYAKGADAQQESRILMLSEKARGDANPILLIEEFEVTAGHAASVGQVDEEQLYYLMSRGLSREDAEHLVIRGFLGPVIVSMPSKKVQQELIAIMDKKLGVMSASGC
ncbi:Fe-S cluster assembly protein SufD [Aerococcaceae bacterium NML160702]|nr:Fe-S cluster assembly protein SufD [Aerococcaceae bacterium NML160702]